MRSGWIGKGTRQWGVAGIMNPILVGVSLALVTQGVSPAAANDLCGTTITANVELDHDLVCAGDGITIGANGVTLSLNGHTISGPQTAVGVGLGSKGIVVNGRSGVRIFGPGTVTGFRTGISIESSSDVRVEGIAAVANGAFAPSSGPFPFSPLSDGILVTMSLDVDLKDNVVADNGDDGINVHMSTGVSVTENSTTNNRHDNIRLDLADGNFVSDNFVLAVSPSPTFPLLGPTICNIELFGSKDNLIEGNHVEGSRFGIRLNQGSTGNQVRQNLVKDAFAAGGQGIRVSGNLTTDNQFKDNTVSGNLVGIGSMPFLVEIASGVGRSRDRLQTSLQVHLQCGA